MGALGFAALAGFFGFLAFDAYRFEGTSRHRIWAVPPGSGRSVGADPLSIRAQQALQVNKLTAVGGIPGLFWVFVILSAACLGVSGWMYFG